LQNLSSTHLPPNAEVLAKLAELGTAPIRSGMSLLDLLRRSEMTYEKLQQAFEVPELPEVVAEQVEIFAKYEGYINKQKQEVEKALKLENKKIPADYLSIKELSSEAAEKLSKVKPASIGQASRISGVSPADVSVLMIALEVMRRKEYES
jgi:tRNA uridine 5-carboxymethylaminomethyl modification enzyme